MENQIVLPAKRRRIKKVLEIETISNKKNNFLDRFKLVKNSIVNKIDDLLLYAVIFLTPLFFLPFTNYPISLNKQVFVFFALAVSFLIFLFGVVNAGKLKIKINLSVVSIILLAAVSLISWFANGDGRAAFFGVFGGESSTPINILIFLTVFLLIQTLLSHDEKKRKISLILLSLSSVFSVLVWLAVQNGVIGSLVSGFSLTNTIGLTSSLVLFSSLGFFILIGFYFEGVGVIKKSVLAALIALFAFIFIILGFKLVWYIVVCGLAFFIAAYFASKQNYETKKAHLFIIIILLIVSLIFTFSSPSLSDETRVTYRASADIANSRYQEGAARMLLGSGPGSFRYSFLQYRDAIIPDISINRMQFSFGYSAITDYFSELGVMGGVSMLLFFASVVFYGIRVLLWQIKRNIYNPIIITLFIATISSFVVNIFGVSNFTNLFYSFVLSAFVVGAYQDISGKEPKVINFSKNSSQTFLMLIFLIGLMVVVALLAFKFGSKYISEIYFQKAQKEILTNNAQGAFAPLEKAIRFNNKDGAYFKTAADINFSLMKEKLGGLNIEDKKAVEDISLQIKNIESLYNQAIILSPRDSSYWSSLGMLYEVASSLDSSLMGSAQQSYEKAAAQDPKSADILFLLGRVYYTNGKYEDAKKILSELVSVFPRDPNPRLYLGLTLMQEGKKDDALRELEIVKLLDPKNAPVDQLIKNIKEENNTK